MKTLIESGLEEQIYFFAINVVSFSKTLQKKNKSINPQIVNIAGELNSNFMDILDLNQEDKIDQSLLKCLQLAEKSHEILINFDCDDKELINEKANLQIENSVIVKKISEFVKNT